MTTTPSRSTPREYNESVKAWCRAEWSRVESSECSPRILELYGSRGRVVIAPMPQFARFDPSHRYSASEPNSHVRAIRQFGCHQRERSQWYAATLSNPTASTNRFLPIATPSALSHPTMLHKGRCHNRTFLVKVAQVQQLGVRIKYIVYVADAQEYKPTILIHVGGFVASTHQLVCFGVGRRA
jgi:hypothetical protein